jgi:UPF0755 protein
MPLQIDATVVYVLDKPVRRLTLNDREVISPYNTYQVRGLPIGPIANPGRASIDAAVNPSDTENLYYVLQNEETGEHYFTDDYEDFLRARDYYFATRDQ